jgi:hypothetical protein
MTPTPYAKCFKDELCSYFLGECAYRLIISFCL